jgi:hypothetical protein
MSHTTAIKGVEITDVHALRLAVKDLNAAGVKCSLLENATPRAYYSNQDGLGKADLVLKLEEASYDVGLYLKDKNYEARTDFWGNSVEKQLGVNDSSVSGDQRKLGKLYQFYAVNATQRALNMKGISTRRTTKEDGTIQLMAHVA